MNENFGRALIDATSDMMKSTASGPVSASLGGHRIVFEGEAENQMVHVRAPMGRPQTLAKAEQHIDAYTREDGTRVTAHTRGGAAKPTPARAIAAKITPPKGTTAHRKQADEHSTLAARHERAADQCGPDSPLYGPHTELAALHLAALRHAYRADSGRNQTERDSSARALRHLRTVIAVGERSLKGGTETTPAATGKSQPMTKSLTPILFKHTSAKAATMAKGGNLAGLLGEMATAQLKYGPLTPSEMMAKSFPGQEAWAFGGFAGAFA